jgi:tripartite-type tricarboxylate transporter receptor subunit TctC
VAPQGHGLESATDADFNLIAFEGSAPAQTATMTGEVDAVVSGIAEQAEFIRAGQFRPLAMTEMDSYEFPDHGTIPAAGDDYPRWEIPPPASGWEWPSPRIRLPT